MAAAGPQTRREVPRHLERRFLSAYVVPSLAGTAPGYVQDLLTVAEGGAPPTSA
jgi:hypothetical protein